MLVACQPADPEPGVSLALARERASAIRDLHYAVHFVIPEQRVDPVSGWVEVTFTLDRPRGPLVLDFRAPPNHLRSASIGGRPVPFATPQDHVVIPRSVLVPGQQTIRLELLAAGGVLGQGQVRTLGAENAGRCRARDVVRHWPHWETSH